MNSPSVFPLLESQLGMRDGHLQEPDSPAFNVGFVTYFGDVDSRPPQPHLLVEATRKTLTEATAMTVRLQVDPDGEWRQLTDPTLEPVVGLIDLRATTDPAADFDAFVADRAAQPFELIDAPLVRCDVIVLDDGHIAMCGWAHHIVIDGYGMALFRFRLRQHFFALMRGTEVPPSPYRHLAELVEHQRTATEDDIDFWVGHLSPLPTRMTFSDRAAAPSPAALTETVAVESSSTCLADRLDEPGAHAVIIGAVAAYVARILDEDESVLGVPLHNRRTPVEASTPAMLMTEIPVRIGVDHAATVATLAETVAVELDRIKAHSLARPERLRAAIPSAWRAGRIHGPTVNVLLRTRETNDDRAVTSSRILDFGPVQDVSIIVGRTDASTATLQISMNPRLYRPIDLHRHIERLGAWIVTCLEAPPTTPIADLEFLTASEVAAHAALSASRAVARQPNTSSEPISCAAVNRWGDTVTAQRLVELTQLSDVESIDIVNRRGFPVTFDEVGEVVSTSSTPVRSGILAAIDEDTITYRGPADERVRVRGRWVERGATRPI